MVHGTELAREVEPVELLLYLAGSPPGRLLLEARAEERRTRRRLYGAERQTPRVDADPLSTPQSRLLYALGLGRTSCHRSAATSV